MIENRKINIILDADGNRLVLINDIVFKGKRNINWDEVKTYLEQYVGDYYEIEESSEKVYIGSFKYAHFILKIIFAEGQHSADSGSEVRRIRLKLTAFKAFGKAFARYNSVVNRVCLVAVGDDELVLKFSECRIDYQGGILYF